LYANLGFEGFRKLFSVDRSCHAVGPSPSDAELARARANTTLPCLLYMGEADTKYAEAKKCVDVLPNVTFVTLPDRARAGK
jgi:hypothetical protein